MTTAMACSNTGSKVRFELSGGGAEDSASRQMEAIVARQSDGLLTWLRDLSRKRGLKTAALAEQSGVPRAHLRKAMSGAADMTVDELLKIMSALDVTPADMGLPDADGAQVDDDLPEPEPEEDLGQIDPWGNHPKQLFETGFALGCDVMMLLDSDALEGSGVPEAVRRRYSGAELPIKLDAAYHKHMNPRYDEDSVTLTIGFDSLCECRFPWTAFRRLIFFPLPPNEPEAEEAPAPTGAPFLRLVD
jgi:DNA-binding phage protein